MEFQSLAEFTNRFFETEYKDLISNYPGLNVNRLISELKSLSSLYSHEDIYSSIYFDLPDSIYHNFFKKLKEAVPLEYITGRSFFYKSEFSVGPQVLIPRSETEILVESVVEIARIMIKNFQKKISICDVGTGSGAIAISLLSEIDQSLDITMTDISNDALEIARRNYFLQQFKINKKSTVDFILTDRLKNIEKKFDIIVSNPPYIKKVGDLATVHSQVAKFEPELALFLDDHVYDSWFSEFFSQVDSCLNEQGVFFMEGHEDHLQNLAKILSKFNFTNIEVIRDYTQRDRFLKGVKLCKN